MTIITKKNDGSIDVNLGNVLVMTFLVGIIIDCFRNK